MTNIVPLNQENIDEFVKEVNRQLAAGGQGWTEFAASTKFQVDPIFFGADTSEFLEFQLGIWKTITGNTEYVAEANEVNDNLDSIDFLAQTYPFSTKSHIEVGNYFTAVANIIRHIGVNPPARIVEFGTGWGHTARLMANCGYRVTAVDIEVRFLKLLEKFNAPGSEKIETAKGSFHEVSFPDQSVDAFVFFECFHHCISHIKLLQNMHASLKDGGRIVFSAEAFYDDWFDYPWGVRLDGHAVWAIRNFGWMELGFRKTYISALLENLGFDLEWSAIPVAGPYGDMLVATKRP